ncbi:MAG TPA: papain-like cysteine protease family protein [Candidatus Acidoferrum sp.]|nr:papain-like cysteine protease family protein [Candidatus Acidoferrum sp.]
MKKLIVWLIILCLALTGCATAAPDTAAPDANAPVEDTRPHGNYTDEMKIPNPVNLDEDYGADSVERDGDHEDSPYFSTLDFYNLESTESLTILPKFKTQQQSSEWNCGVSAVLMVLNWYDALGDYNEESLAEFRSNGTAPEATSLKQAMEIFEGVGGFDLYTTFDCADTVSDVFTLEYIQETLADGKPIMIGWNDWGGHWQVIVGYDTMATETAQDDVLIVADPYDTTDHNQDGYGVYGAERFIYNFTFYNFFDEADLNDMCFIVATPQA